MLTTGARIGHYEVVSHLGSGGMGVVYGASDKRLDRRVAVKLLSQESGRDERAVGRLRREGRAASALNQLAYLLSIPSRYSPALLRVDPVLAPLREHPRFRSLVEWPSRPSS